MHTQDDLLLADTVRNALITHEDDYESITITAERGIVTLSGNIANETERKEVLRITRNVSGVLDVKDLLQVGSDDSNSVGEYIDDTLITTKVKGKILAEAGLSSFSISVETNQGIVTLRGDVDKHETASLAERVAKMVNGVKRVDNRLVYKP